MSTHSQGAESAETKKPRPSAAEEHWAKVRASIPADFFKYTKPLETPRMAITEDEAADIAKYRQTRRAILAADSTANSARPDETRERHAVPMPRPDDGGIAPRF